MGSLFTYITLTQAWPHKSPSLQGRTSGRESFFLAIDGDYRGQIGLDPLGMITLGSEVFLHTTNEGRKDIRPVFPSL